MSIIHFMNHQFFLKFFIVRQLSLIQFFLPKIHLSGNGPDLNWSHIKYVMRGWLEIGRFDPISTVQRWATILSCEIHILHVGLTCWDPIWGRFWDSWTHLVILSFYFLWIEYFLTCDNIFFLDIINIKLKINFNDF